MEKSHYDVCVIGAGPSGFAAAMRAIDLGKKVALIEKNKLGGAGIYNGALSSKTLWELSERYTQTQTNRYGFTVYESELNFKAVINEMHRSVNDRYTQLKTQADYYEKQGNLTLIHGKAVFKDSHTVDVFGSDQKNNKTLTATHFVLAVGSRPRLLPHIDVDENKIITSDGIGKLSAFPKSMVILGAGVIGCEFATIFSNFGKTKVYLIDKADRILPFEDDDISNTVSSNLESKGVHIHRNSQLVKMKKTDTGVEYELKFKDGHTEIHHVEKALISVGRVPNSDQMGLEDIGLELSDRGHCIDKNTCSNIDHIYAVGDFTADIALVNIAELEGRHAIERMYGITKQELRYDNISTIMFLNPEVAGVGINEQQAREKGISYKMAKMKFKYVNRAIAMRKRNGFFKLLVTNDDEMKVLGMRVLGEHASSTVEAIALLISMKGTVNDLVELVHPHPSIPEGIQECARMLCGKSIIKPEVFNLDLECYRVSENGKIQHLHEFEENVNSV